MATKKSFKHQLGDTVTIRASGEAGEVRSRNHSLDSNPSYYLAYKSADGQAKRDWFFEDELSGAAVEAAEG